MIAQVPWWLEGLINFAVAIALIIALTLYQAWVFRREDAPEPRGFPIEPKKPKYGQP